MRVMITGVTGFAGSHLVDYLLTRGDCDIYGIKVCTCGLMHDLMPVPHLIEKLYPLHWEERGKYDEVRSSIMNSSRKTRKKRKK